MNITQPHGTILNAVVHDTSNNELSQSLAFKFKSLANVKHLIDLSYLSDTDGFSKIQTVFIDNYENNGDVIIEVLNTDQRIICKANKQGYFPILSDTRAKFKAYHTGTGEPEINLNFLNFIIAQGSW